jgi:nuclear pore complex protein Nup62
LFLIRTTPADQDREKAYHIAEMLNSKLNDMSGTLSVIIQQVNQSKVQKIQSPMTHIVQVLNDHLTCLEWIERSNQELESKLEQLRVVEEEAIGVQERIHHQKNIR